MFVIIAIIPAAMTFLALKVATVISQELKGHAGVVNPTILALEPSHF